MPLSVKQGSGCTGDGVGVWQNSGTGGRTPLGVVVMGATAGAKLSGPSVAHLIKASPAVDIDKGSGAGTGTMGAAEASDFFLGAAEAPAGAPSAAAAARPNSVAGAVPCMASIPSCRTSSCETMPAATSLPPDDAAGAAIELLPGRLAGALPMLQ